MSHSPTVLALQGISKRFPGVQALDDINLSLRAGEVHALLGENGAGKSTLMKILSGIERPDQGQILLAGRECRFDSYRDARAAGVGMVFQEFSLIPDLDAVDNLFLGRYPRNRWARLDRRQMLAQAREMFGSLGVDMPLEVPVARLSVAMQQFVEIAKALSLQARILVLDEPTATLTPQEARRLFGLMRRLQAQQVAMVFISHHLDEIFEVCDQVSVLRDGRNAGHARVADTSVDELVRMMVGRQVAQSYPPRQAGGDAGRPVLEVSGIQLAPEGPVNAFELREGEILGFAGLVGSGRSELALGLIGAGPVHAKQVRIDGRPRALRSPAEALACGVGLLPENRKAQGLLTEFSIRFNISVNQLRRFSRHGLLRRRAETQACEAVCRRLGVKAGNIEARVGTLSGGNQQKVVIARWLSQACKVLIFDEPTRGIDVGAKAEIYALMRELTQTGVAIILISSELPEIVGLSDRVAVFAAGRIVCTLVGPEIQATELLRHAARGTAT
ncbi:MAG: sugar ABC transporter ATP-binding protein [Curvibacter sp.]|nr:sugar ABC transporter ATP-binding protein [Curvibacter sp.]